MKQMQLDFTQNLSQWNKYTKFKSQNFLFFNKIIIRIVTFQMMVLLVIQNLFF